MEVYDLVHIEDDPRVVEIIEYWTKKNEISYRYFPALDELSLNRDTFFAKAWAVDGRFPISKGELVKYNADQAVRMIRERDSDAKIILYSGEMDLAEYAINLDVESIGKNEANSARRLVERVIEIGSGHSPRI